MSDERYLCETCHDQGWVMVPHAGGWGDDDMPCPARNCPFKEKR